MTRRVGALLALICWPMGASAAANATLTLAELVGRSDAVVLGRALDTRAAWQGTRIVTSARIRVDELWLGSVAGQDTIEVVTLGGEVGELGQRVDGAAALHADGRMVLCLKRLQDEYVPVRMAEGVFDLDGPFGDEAFVRQQARPRGARHAAVLVGPPSGGLPGRQATLFSLRQQGPTLAWLREAVRAAAAETRSEP